MHLAPNISGAESRGTTQPLGLRWGFETTSISSRSLRARLLEVLMFISNLALQGKLLVAANIVFLMGALSPECSFFWRHCREKNE